MNDEKNEPPNKKNIMDFGTGIISTFGALVRPTKRDWSLWSGDRSICPVGISLHGRRLAILVTISEEVRAKTGNG